MDNFFDRNYKYPPTRCNLLYGFEILEEIWFFQH